MMDIEPPPRQVLTPGERAELEKEAADLQRLDTLKLIRLYDYAQNSFAKGL